jgi:hypothetical protein
VLDPRQISQDRSIYCVRDGLFGGTRRAMSTGMQVQRSLIQFSLVVALLTPMMTGCQVVEAIFKAGLWVGILSVLTVFGLIAWGLKSLLS